ncbi:MAG: hypothetical protein ACLVES_08880 [Faecalibacterium prausnitzii]
MFNRDLFRAKCIEHGIRAQDAAQIMGINPATLSRKMGGQSDFTRNEIQLFRAALHLTRRRPMLRFRVKTYVYAISAKGGEEDAKV